MTMQLQYYITVKISKNSVEDSLVLIIYEYILKSSNPLPLRSKIISKEQSFNADYISLLKQLFDVICEYKVKDDIKKQHLIIVSEHLYRSSFVVDQEINFFSCLLNLAEVN